MITNDIDYHFNLYLKGPYASSLASDVYLLVRSNLGGESSLKFDDQFLKNNLEKLNKVKKLIAKLKDSEICSNLDICLEIVASFLYVYKYSSQAKGDIDKAIDILIDAKPYFTKEAVKKLVDLLKEMGIIKS